MEIDFNQIDTFHTGLFHAVNFKKNYDYFIEQYKKDEKFKDIVRLFLYTTGSKHKLYDNIFQKIAQLQTIFETLLGQPKSEQCLTCERDRYVEEWRAFLSRTLKEKGIADEKYITLIIKIKNTLHSARCKYVHRSDHLNIRQKYIEEIKTGHYSGQSEYTTNFDDILKKDAKNWASIDWENAYRLYQHIVKQLIYLEYLNQKIG